jgi:hypothetical protein
MMASRHSSSSITLPHCDITLEVPKNNKRRRIYKAPFILKAKISSATNFSELKAQLREMAGNRNLTPNTRRLCERLRGWIGEYCNLKSQRLKNEKAKDIETTATAMQSWLEKIHGEFGLSQTIIDYHQEMVHRWLLLDFGDLLAADWSDFKRKSNEANQKSGKNSQAPKNTWHGHERYDSQHLAEMILDERQQMRRYNGVVRDPQGDSADGVLAEIEKAAGVLDRKAEDIEWEILTYAERNSMAYNSIEKDAMNGYLNKAALTLAKSRQALREMSFDQRERLEWERCIDVFQQRWFVAYDESDFHRFGLPPFHTPSELGNAAMERRWQREKNDLAFERNKAELKDSYEKREDKGGLWG